MFIFNFIIDVAQYKQLEDLCDFSEYIEFIEILTQQVRFRSNFLNMDEMNKAKALFGSVFFPSI